MSRTTDRTKLAAQWLPADVMRDKHHERECTYSRVIHYDDGSAEVDESCICDRLRACEQRVLDAAREAVAATFTGWCADPTTCTDYEHVCGGRRDALAAIDALKEKA